MRKCTDKRLDHDYRPPPGGRFSQREHQVLVLVSQGLTNPQIGRLLNVSPHTVKTHLDNILNKLGVNNRTQAAVWAAKNDLA